MNLAWPSRPRCTSLIWTEKLRLQTAPASRSERVPASVGPNTILARPEFQPISVVEKLSLQAYSGCQAANSMRVYDLNRFMRKVLTQYTEYHRVIAVIAHQGILRVRLRDFGRLADFTRLQVSLHPARRYFHNSANFNSEWPEHGLTASW